MMSSTDEARDSEQTPILVRLTHGLEAAKNLDRAERLLNPLARACVSSPRRRDLLHGTFLGHALHPLLTDLPLGAWMSTSILDLVGGAGAQQAARRLLGIGLLAAGPTAATGLAEWSTTTGVNRRVGVAHASLNTAGLMLYGGSYLARRRGRRALGVVLALGGAAFVGGGGFLGGHLVIARKVGSRDPQFAGSSG